MKHKKVYDSPETVVVALHAEGLICASEQINSSFGMGTLNDNDLGGLFVDSII